MPDPLWINADAGAPAYTAAELRQAMALALVYGGRNMGGRGGVRPGGNQLQVSLAGATITVQPGVACIDPGLSTPQGPYWVAIPITEQHTLQAADSTNPRKDIVIARVYDHDEDTSGLRLARTEYLAGVAAAVPAEPAVPAGAIQLSTIDVPASGGGSPAVTDRRPYTVAAGGMLPVRDQAERDALTAFAGLRVWRLDLSRDETHDGTAWREARVVVQVLTASGTWNRPSGAKTVLVEVLGGGGAGGGAAVAAAGQHSMGAGGGSGEYARRLIAASALTATVAVTVGGAGAGGAGAVGGAGGTSSFGAILTAAGGTGGAVRGSESTSFGSAGGAGGTGGAGTADIRTPGAPGGSSWGDGSLSVSGSGASSIYGSGGRGRDSGSGGASQVGADAAGYGAGGGGAQNNAGAGTARSGGAGAPGVVIATTFL